MLKIVGMLDSKNNTTLEATMPLETDYDGPPFDNPWEYAYVFGMLMYLSSNFMPDIQFAVHLCDSFTHNPMNSLNESVKRICHYLVVTEGQGLTFEPTSDIKLD